MPTMEPNSKKAKRLENKRKKMTALITMSELNESDKRFVSAFIVTD